MRGYNSQSFSASNEHRARGAKARNSRFASLSNAAIGAKEPEKSAIYGHARYISVPIKINLKYNQLHLQAVFWTKFREKMPLLIYNLLNIL